MSINPDKQFAEPDAEMVDDEPGQEIAGNRFLFFQVMPGWLTSFLIHLVLIILLAIFTFDIPGKVLVSLESGEATEEVASLDSISFDSLEKANDLNQNSDVDVPDDMDLNDILPDTEPVSEEFTETFADFMEESKDESNSSEMDANDSSGLLAGTSSLLSGRKPGQREKAARQNGGTPASENAVNLAMKWIADHQLPDGNWSFDHRAGPGTHRTSPNPGDFTRSPRAATAMALLVFLGAGQTQLEGDYTQTVEKGLAWLVSNAQKTRNGWSWEEDQGGLYNHGLAAIALCEAYAMTGDVRLLEPAKQALRYVEYSQDPYGGGWRYVPRTRGDLSVSGWQVMAIKSAHMCGLEVDADVIRKTRRFLNFVSSESGAFYGYTDPTAVGERRKGMTAVGLLCQIYMGWSRDNPALGTGVKWLGDRGPEIGDWKAGQDVSEAQKDKFRSGMYYNYYATQVMSQYGGEKWTKWNEEMRDFLVATQVTAGAAKGSWFFQDPDESGYVHGGRLYATTLAAMTLEVYYRYLPLYDQKKTNSSEFELD
jgi:hypothetical protein